MKKKKKLASLIMAFIMVFGLFPFSSTTAFAFETATGTYNRADAPTVKVGTTEVYTTIDRRFYKFIAPSTGIFTISTSDSEANPNTDTMSSIYFNDDTTSLAGDTNDDQMGHVSYTAHLEEGAVYYIDVQNVSENNKTCMLNILAPAVLPTLTAGTVNRTSDTTATVNFTSDTAGSYYYKVVADGAGEPTIDTDGGGTACSTSETTITNPIGLTAGAMDIYIKVKDGAGNVSNALQIDIAAYDDPLPSGGTNATFDFEASTSIGATNNIIEQMVNSETISLYSEKDEWIIGNETDTIGVDISIMSGNVVSVGQSAPTPLVRLTVKGGKLFTLDSFSFADCCYTHHTGNIIAKTSKGQVEISSLTTVSDWGYADFTYGNNLIFRILTMLILFQVEEIMRVHNLPLTILN